LFQPQGGGVGRSPALQAPEAISAPATSIKLNKRMKKVLLGAGMLMLLVCAGLESKAIGIGKISIKVNYERGIKEWNKDHTAADCIGKGICRISVDIGWALQANLGTDDKGKLLILIPVSTANQVPGDFMNHGTYPLEDLTLTPEMVRSLGFANGYKIAKGNYPVELDNMGRYFCIQIQ
jgi:hypothetical protein